MEKLCMYYCKVCLREYVLFPKLDMEKFCMYYYNVYFNGNTSYSRNNKEYGLRYIVIYSLLLFA